MIGKKIVLNSLRKSGIAVVTTDAQPPLVTAEPVSPIARGEDSRMSQHFGKSFVTKVQKQKKKIDLRRLTINFRENFQAKMQQKSYSQNFRNLKGRGEGRRGGSIYRPMV